MVGGGIFTILGIPIAMIGNLTPELSIIGLSFGRILILYYKFLNKPKEMFAIIVLYIFLALSAWLFTKKKNFS